MLTAKFHDTSDNVRVLNRDSMLLGRKRVPPVGRESPRFPRLRSRGPVEARQGWFAGIRLYAFG